MKVWTGAAVRGVLLPETGKRSLHLNEARVVQLIRESSRDVITWQPKLKPKTITKA